MVCGKYANGWTWTIAAVEEAGEMGKPGFLLGQADLFFGAELEASAV